MIRAYAEEGDVQAVDKTWKLLITSNSNPMCIDPQTHLAYAWALAHFRHSRPALDHALWIFEGMKNERDEEGKKEFKNSKYKNLQLIWETLKGL